MKLVIALVATASVGLQAIAGPSRSQTIPGERARLRLMSTSGELAIGIPAVRID
jgi:hypothetical protein